VSLAKTDEQIEVPLVGQFGPTCGSKNHRRHLENTTERTVRDGDAALCRVFSPVSNYFAHLLLMDMPSYVTVA